MSQTDTVEFVLRHGGEIIRRTVSENMVAVPDNLISALNKDVSVPLARLLDIQQWGFMSLMVTGAKLHYATVSASRIILRTAYDLIDKKEKIFSPNFGSSDPMMELAWTPPGDMRLIILMTLQQHDATYSIPKCWLFAMDDRGAYWKLPLSNIYEDGAICEGREIGRYPSILAAVMNMLETFDRSRWNRDLWQDKDQTLDMFRFQSVDDQFVTLPPREKKWTKLCSKIALDVHKHIIL